MRRSPEINYQYFRHYVESLPMRGSLRVLDYGCGAGEIVARLREAGLHAEGCDVYYEGASSEQSPQARELLQSGHVRIIDEQADLPYAPKSFDVIVTNMVFEHVRDLDAVLRRLERVLKPDGHILAHFPTKEVFREGHIGIPFVHRFPPASRVRAAYALALRMAGLGYFKDQADGPREWTRRHLAWLDTYCHYRSMPELRQLVDGRFDVSFNEMQYMRFRAGGRLWLRRLIDLPLFAPLWSWLFRRAAFTALVLRPTHSGHAER